jgi:hypothetical protein
MNTYMIAGFTVQSDVPLTFAPKAKFSDEVDVQVKLAEQLQPPKNSELNFICDDASASIDTIWFRAQDDLHFAVKGGHTIFVSTTERYNSDDISLFINGSGMGAIALQRGQIPFHVSGNQIGAKLVAITGESGAGKSTLAATLARIGLAHFTDDVGVVNPQENPLEMRPMPKGIKLTGETAQQLSVSVAGEVSETFGLKKRYADNLPQSSAESLLFGALYVISKDNAAEFSIRELKGGEKYSEIRKAIYRNEWLGAFYTPQQIFALITNLAQKISVFAFSRPRDLGQAIESAAFLKAHAEAVL